MRCQVNPSNDLFIQGVGSTIEKSRMVQFMCSAGARVRHSRHTQAAFGGLDIARADDPCMRSHGDVVVLLQGEGGSTHVRGKIHLQSLMLKSIKPFHRCWTRRIGCMFSKFDTARLVCRRSSTALDSDRDGHTPYHCHRVK